MKKRLSHIIVPIIILMMIFVTCVPGFAQEQMENPTEEQTEEQVQQDLSQCSITCDEKVLYSGKEICPEVVVMLNEAQLVEGIDFVAEYSSNIDPGTGKITVTGMGNYCGSAEKSFEIIKKLEKVKVTADNAESSGKPVLTWNESEGADGYEVYRASSSAGNYSLIATVKKCTYTDKTATHSKLYYYKVKAVDNDFDQASSNLSKYVSRRCDLARPTVSGSNAADSGKPVLTWSKISGADKYNVYRSTSQNGTYTKIATVAAASYTDTTAKQSKAYYYKVKAIDSDISSANSAYSKVVKRTCDLPRTSVTASNVSKSGKPKLTWSPINGAEKYMVYRSTSKNGKYVRMYTTSKTSYINTSAKAGVTYYYKVVAVDSDNTAANSAYSKVVRRTCDISKPQIKLVDNLSTGKPKLTWSKLSGADKYEIYRAETKTGKYTKVGTTSKATYTDTSAKAGYTYYYKIKAVNTDNSAATSVYSNVVYQYVIDPNKKMVALTFDDGPGPYTDEIIDCLKENRAHATFYVLGERMEYWPDAVEKAYKNGNEIGNHTYSHATLTYLSSSGIKSELSKTDSKIKDATGSKAATMRPPGGGVNSTVRDAAGKPIIYWSIDTEDWRTRSKSATVNAVMNNVKDGDIVLMHDIHYSTMEAALELIPKLKASGYQLVTVSEMAKYQGYTMENGTVYYSFR